MAYPKLNSRSIRLFAATPEDIERKRPNLNAPHFRILRSEIEKLLDLSDGGDPMISLSIWRRKGRDGKPDYFTAELGYPDTKEAQTKWRTADDKWMIENQKSVKNSEDRRNYAAKKAMNEKALEDLGLAGTDAEVIDQMPF